MENNLVTLSEPGNYRLKGTLTNGGLVIDTTAEGVVRLILDGVSLTNSSGAAIYIKNADKVILVLADNSINSIADGENYSFESVTEDDPNAAIFSKTDLTIYGNGSLEVTGKYQDGITSQDGLIIASGTLRVTAADDGIRGKDYLVVKEGELEVTAGGDALKADREDEADPGSITLLDGTYNINANGDAITAQGAVVINSGSYNITTGGGSETAISTDTSAKAIKSASNITVQDGVFNLDSADDNFNANGTLLINGGSYTLFSADDAMHADASLIINDGDILVKRSYEGFESLVVEINGGLIHLNAADDGINISDGSGANDMAGFMTAPAVGPGGMDGVKPEGGLKPDRGSQPLGDQTLPQEGMEAMQPQNEFMSVPAAGGSGSLTLSNGSIVINAEGDGLDVNGNISMSGGLLIIQGPTADMNGAIDYDASFTISGGSLIAVGSSGMAQAPDTSSTQNSILVNFSTPQEAGTLVNIQEVSGNEILTFQCAKTFQSLVFSSPSLVDGSSYTLSLGGSTSGVMTDFLVQDGVWTGGSAYTSFTITEPITMIGNSGRNR